MKYLFAASLLFTFSTSKAQVKLNRIVLQINAGIGISNKPSTMFGAPLFLSSELRFTFNNQWRIVAEGGTVGFRDSEYPTQKIGLIVSSYSQYQHNYGGLRIGRNLLNTTQSGELILSGGADYLAVIEPNVKRSTGFLGGLYFDYQLKRYLNIPVQIDYSVKPFHGSTQLVFSGRWNFNPYHSFPTISAGVGILMYNKHDESASERP